MATLTIRNINDKVKAKLLVNPAGYAVSMEEDVRQTLTRAVMTSANDADSRRLATRIRDRMKSMEVEGVDPEVPPRELPREPPDFKGRFAPPKGPKRLPKRGQK